MLILEDIKANINKIDFQLKEVFENVNIKEKSDRVGHFFEINTDSNFLFEDNSWKKAGVRVKIYKQDLLIESVRWFYQVDTLNESSDWIERVSPISRVGVDINNVILLKQMSEDYFSKLESTVEMINESASQIVETDIESKVENILLSYGIKIEGKSYDESVVLENNQFMSTRPDQKIKFLHNSEIKISDKFRIEALVKSFEGVNYILFRENEIEVDYTPSI